MFTKFVQKLTMYTISETAFLSEYAIKGFSSTSQSNIVSWPFQNKRRKKKRWRCCQNTPGFAK